MIRIASGCWITAGWLGVATLCAQLPVPRLHAVFPPGGAAGSTVEVTVTGSDLDEATGLVFSDPRIVGTPVPGSSDRFRVPLPAGMSGEQLDLRVQGRHGVSNPRAFSVGPAARELQWTQPPLTPAQAFDLPLEAVVNGRMGAIISRMSGCRLSFNFMCVPFSVIGGGRFV